MSRVLMVIAVLAALPAHAQWEFFVRGNGQLYENFFQAPKGSPEEDVTAVQGEVGASLDLTKALTAYGQIHLTHYNDDAIDDSPGGRIGLRGDSNPHSFDVYLEMLKNRPSFELDEIAGADVTRVNGEYAYRFLKDWQASADADFEQQEYDNELRDNDYHQFGAAVRWRGLRLFSPQIGVRMGERDVNDPLQSYDQSEWYLQIRSQPSPKWYLSARYRDRTRDYQNIDREDKRRQINFSADYSMTEELVLNFYGAKEDVDSNVADRDFDIGYFLAGVTWKF